MEATKVGLGAYLAGFGEAVGDGCEAALASVEIRLRALIAPMAPESQQMQGFCRAVYAQYRHELASAEVGMGVGKNRLRSFRIGEYSATLESVGLTREQALFDAGLCGEARAILLDLGLLYRGVSAC